jgi:pimeloyl-ACP methyl ester carboxylesterase
MTGPEERLLAVGQRRVNAALAGAGPPVVLVHGLGGTWRYWYRTIDALCERFRVLAPDVPGFGRSDTLEPFTIDGAGDLLLAAWEAAGVERPTLVGHSMGGAIAASLAARRPADVGRLVLVCAAGFSRLSARRAAFMLPMSRVALGNLSWWEEEAVGRLPWRRFLFRYVVADPAALSPEDARMLLRGAAQARQMAAGSRAVLAADLRAAIRGLAVPLTVLWGERDAVVPVADAATLVRLVPGAEVQVLQTGHMPMLEAPEAFAEMLAEAASPASPARAAPRS